MKVLTSREMKEIDRKTIEDIGIPGPVLMENAGLQIVRVLRALFPRPEREKIVIVAGKGNNGGDGLVVARHLFNHGASPLVLLLGSKEDVRGDAAINLKIAAGIGVTIIEIRSEEEWKKWKKNLQEATIIIDAIFGTGLVEAARGIYERAINDINKSGAFRLAVDIPSGLSSDSFEIIGPAVRADLTVTLAAPKIAHVFPPAEEMVGDFLVADISVPRHLLQDPNLRLELVDKADLRPAFIKRKNDTHKGSYGHLFIIAGSLGKTGAATMAAKAALKTGAGLVTVGTPASCLPIVARSMVELMTEPLEETSKKTISAEALSRTLNLIKGKDALLLGPGISTNEATAEFVWKLIPKIKIPVVIDADGLNILGQKRELLTRLSKPAILTPHPGEFGRLVDLPIAEVLAKRLELVPAFAKKYGVYLVLKGYRTLIGAPDGRVFINPTGNPGMATGGSGDVLTGILTGLLGQGLGVWDAARLGVHLHGLAGDIAARHLTQLAMTAQDVLRFLPQAWKELGY